MKNDTEDGLRIFARSRGRAEIKSRFSSNTWYPERSVKSSRSNDTPTIQVENLKSGEVGLRYVCRCSTSRECH